MNNDKCRFTDRKFVKSLIVIAGIVFGQAVLYGPSLVGQKILLPLDILAQPGIYIPSTPGRAAVVPRNPVLSDLVLQMEPARQFAISELHQGRFPLWAPYEYGGVPFIWPKYSPFLLLECCTRSPLILAWTQLFAALVAGVGMFFFCRKSLRVGFWPATVCAWCYPLTGFFVLWQGYFTALPVCWLPWLFLAVDKTVRGKSSSVPIALGVLTFLVLTSGQIDISGQVLLGSGIYALWCLWHTYPGEWFRRKSRSAVTMLILGWGLGFLLAAPYLLPVLEYAKTGSRMIHRSAGAEERPPVGLAALPQVVLPDIYGTSEKGSTFLAHRLEGNLLESSSAAYAGVLATLLMAPLAWCSRRHRAVNLFWVFLAFFGMSWCLDMPGFVNLLRLPGLNIMSHNRLVFLTSFAILAMTAIGLEGFLQAQIERRRWFWLAAALLSGLCVWCIYLSLVLPGQLPAQLESFVSQGKHLGKIRDMEDVWRFQAWFTLHYAVMAAFCLVGFAGWLLVYFQGSKSYRWFPVLAICLVGDLLWFGYGLSAQCHRALYYPKIPVLDRVAQSVPGRVIGVHCLPAPLAMMAGLSDIRGYDAVDPARMVNLLKTAVAPGIQPPNAAVQYVAPKEAIQPPDTLRLPPVLNMLDVRYLIFQGDPPPDIHPPFQKSGYWALVNSNALPRVFVPESVETISNAREELEKLASPQFDPAYVAYVESPVDLPASCDGAAQITNETPTRVMVSVHMKTPGLVVLADNWDQGWRAYWNDKPVPVLRTDYAIRGVVLPAGNGTLEFVYRPRSLVVGLWLAGLGVIMLSAWLVANRTWITASQTRAIETNHL